MLFEGHMNTKSEIFASLASERLMTSVEAATFLALAASTLAKMRLRGDGPRYRRVGRRAVRYAMSDLRYWLDECSRTSTSDPGSNEP
jgi:predicted DNA-binding transcriptional regulator AlpA